MITLRNIINKVTSNKTKHVEAEYKLGPHNFLHKIDKLLGKTS